MRQNLCFRLEWTISGAEVAKILSQQNQAIRPQMMFESVSEHFANFRHVKQGKTCVSAMNALFQGTEVAKMVSQWNQPFYPNRPQTMFQSVSKHFANLRLVKSGKTCVFGLNELFRVPKLRKCFRNEINLSTPLEPKRCLRFFRSILQTFGSSNEAKLVF